MTGATTGPLRVVIAAGTVEQRDFVQPYRIQIENGAPEFVRCVIVFHVVGRTPDQPPIELVVKPGEIGEIEIRVPLGAAPKRLAVLLRGDRIAYNSEVTVPALEAAQLPARPPLRRTVTTAPVALPPPRPVADLPAVIPEPLPAAAAPSPRPRFDAGIVGEAFATVPRTLLFGLIAGVCAGAALLLGIALGRPDVAQLAPPSPVAAGANVDVPYRVGGIGTATYRVADAAGTTIDAGTLHGRDGSVRFALPSHVRGRTVRITVEIAGPFGSAQRSAAFDVLALTPSAAPRPAPHIAMLAVDHATVNPGDTVNVSYRVEPPSGDVALVDAFGDALASVPLGPSGHATLQLPPQSAGRELAVVVRARNASGVAESRIPLVVGQPPASAPAEDPRAGPTAGSSGLDVSDRRVASGERIVVRIETNYDALRLELFDRAHRSVAAVDLGPGLHEAALIAPRVRTPTEYTLEATEGQGAAQATSIFPISVVPADGRTP